MIQFILNRELVATTAPPASLLLDLLRREYHLPGTKDGCREGDCGACSILVGHRVGDLVEYRSVASCLLPVGSVQGKHLVTIEGLNRDILTPVQQAVVREGASQCGFCTPGIIIALTAFLLGSTVLGEEQALGAIAGNICRCTGYTSIRRAVQRLLSGLPPDLATLEDRLPTLVAAGLVPDYFLAMGARLDSLESSWGADTQGDDSIAVGGGTDLFVRQPELLQKKTLRFLGQDSRLRFIDVEEDKVHIGAATDLSQLKDHEQLGRMLPGWNQALSRVASTQIRNSATLGGNIVNASPIADLAIILLALDAELLLTGPGSERRVSLDCFYQGYKQMDLETGEIVSRISFSRPRPGSCFNFEKVARREYLDIASVNTAMLLEQENGSISKARLAAGGVAPIPLYLDRCSTWLIGKGVSVDTVGELTRRVDADIAPIDDVRGSALYKRRLLRRLIIGHFVQSFPDLDLEAEML